jgi:multiple sugar transport system permease protein
MNIRKFFGIRQWLTAFPFLAPTAIGVVVIVLYPLIASFYYSLTRWNMLSDPVWIGLKNYIDLLKNPVFWKVLSNTLYYLVLYVPFAVVIPLVLAFLVNQKLKLSALYRSIFFLPVITSTVAIAMVWICLYNYQFGMINFLLGKLRIAGPNWIGDPAWAMVSVVVMSVWKTAGYNMVIYLGGLQGIPSEYYEAASIDGASTYKTFFHITIPLITPSTFFVLIISLINSFQVFEATYILTKGGPVNATLTMALQIYRTAFEYLNMGTASAYAWILLLLTLIVTLIQFMIQKRWVFYT